MDWQSILQLGQHHQTAGYLLLFFSMILEATLTLLAAVILMAQKLLNPFIGIPVVIVGAIAEQIILYWAGLKLGSVKKINEWTGKVAHRFDQRLHRHPLQMLVLSKFAYGLHRSVLLRSGMINLGWKKYLKASLPALFLWMLMLGALGYGLSESYVLLQHYLKYAELIPLGIVIILFLSEYLFTKRLEEEPELKTLQTKNSD